MIRIKLMDSGTLEIPRAEAIELVPYRGVLVSSLLKSPIEALVVHRGKPVPLLGPLPAEPTDHLPAAERAWILVLKGCAQVVCGLPDFDDAIAHRPATDGTDDNVGLLQELDQLLKAA